MSKKRKKKRSHATERRPMAAPPAAEAELVILHHRIDRSLVTLGDIAALTRDCNQLYLGKRSPWFRYAKQSVLLTFCGYDDDPREIHEIPEIREYCWKILEHIPVTYMCDDVTMEALALCTVFTTMDRHRAGPGMSSLLLQGNKELAIKWCLATGQVVGGYASRLGLSPQEAEKLAERAARTLIDIRQGKSASARLVALQ